jgi:hypothetical protein
MGEFSALHWTLIAVIVLLACGGRGAYVADRKDRPGLEGFLLGLFLGPIGIALEYALRDGSRRKQALRKKRKDEEELARRLAEWYEWQPGNPPGRKNLHRPKAG